MENLKEYINGREDLFMATNVSEMAEALEKFLKWNNNNLSAKMQRQNIIITMPELELWSNFKKMCEVKNLPYHSLKMKKFPIDYKGVLIYKKKVN